MVGRRPKASGGVRNEHGEEIPGEGCISRELQIGSDIPREVYEGILSLPSISGGERMKVDGANKTSR